MSPGPLMARTIQRSKEAGTSAGVFLTLGHGVVEIAFSLLLIAGLRELVGRNSIAVTMVAFAGAAVLAFMGFSSLRAGGGEEIEEMTEGRVQGGTGKNIAGLIGSGMLLSVLNPYWVIWWLTVGAGFILAMGRDWLSYWVFLGAHISSDAVVYIPLAFLVSKGLGKKQDSRKYRWVETCCGVFFVLFAGLFLAYGAMRLM